jgi:hypothetical protein
VITAAIIGLVLLLPSIHFFLSPQARLRFQEVNIFTESQIVKTSNQEIANDNNVWWSKILHNRRVGYGLSFLQHYLDNLSADFLFIKGDPNPKFSTQEFGQMHFIWLPFFIAGILFLFRKREGNWWIIPFWLLIAIIPAGVARETPHALRTEASLPTFQVLAAYGLVSCVLLTKASVFKYPLQKLFIIFIFIIAGLSVVFYFEDYFIHYPSLYSAEWQYGYKDAISYSLKNESKYKQIYFTPDLGRPYIYTLFYKKYDPKIFRKEANIQRDAFGFVAINNFGKYYFDQKYIKQNSETLYIDVADKVPSFAKIQKVFYKLDGEPVLKAYTL